MAATALAGGCAHDRRPSVQLGFHPTPGTQLVYDIDVHTSVVTRVGAPADRHSSHVRFTSTQVVLDGPSPRLDIEVVASGVDGPQATRHYIARLDRSGALAALESVDGLPASVDGDLGPATVLPGATGAVPARRLRPGDGWSIDQRLVLPGYRGRLTGRGRLVGLRTSTATARVATATKLPVRRKVAAPAGEIEMIGSQATTTDADYDAATGVIVRARAKTVGKYVVVIPPPPGTTGKSVRGTLELTVTSTSVRHGSA